MCKNVKYIEICLSELIRNTFDLQNIVIVSSHVKRDICTYV